MPAKSSKPKRAESRPWEMPFDHGSGTAYAPKGSGITQSKLNKRMERFLRLKRAGRDFSNPIP